MIERLLETIREDISGFLAARGGVNPVVQLERAADPAFGEFATNVALKYAKDLKQSPMMLAEELTAHLREKKYEGVDKVEFVRPGFINIFLTRSCLFDQVQTIITARDNFGKNEALAGEKWVIEHTSPNPNKAMHIGHLRLNLIGMGIVRLVKLAGAQVVADAVYNDRGIAIAKAMYGFLAYMKKSATVPTDITYFADHQDEWLTPESKMQKPDEFVSLCYLKGEEDFIKSPQIEQTVRQMVVGWEANDESVWKLWRHILQYVYIGNERVLNRLGSYWDKVWYEHEHYQRGKDYVERGLSEGVFKKLEDGAVLTNLEERYHLPDTIVLKKDGTSLYITQDIALTDLKKKAYQADKLVWVVGPEQSLAMKQLFAVCEQLGIGKLSDFTHVTYGNVSLRGKDGGPLKMSSRAGTVILIDDLLDEVKGVIKARFVADGKHEPWRQEELSEKLALAAVKFAFLKSDKDQDLVFDVEQSIDVQGDSGLYVVYTYVRTQSILRRATGTAGSVVTVPADLGAEAALVRSLLYFDEVIKQSLADLSVHHVAQYLLEVSSEFNRWYAKETILDGSPAEPYKLAIVAATGIVIKNGFTLLGIPTVDEM